MLSIDDFKPLGLEDKPIFDNFYAAHPPLHSEYMFTTLASWAHYINCRYVILDRMIVIMTEIEGQRRFRPPVGQPKKNIFNQVLRLAKKEDVDFPLGLIDTKTREWMAVTYPDMSFTPQREFFDYVYLAEDLKELKGTPYSKIRNRLNKFKKIYFYKTERINEDSIDEIKTFLERWCLWKDCEKDPLLENEKKAILYSMKHFLNLKLQGISIRINGTIEAISVFEQMNSDTAVVHYEKASPDYDGIYKAINQETAQYISNHLKFINRESDMGIPGLRKAKLSYNPHHMVEVFHVKKDDINFSDS